MRELDTERLIRTLQDHGVRFVLVGGMAAVAHGSALPTEDVDIAPARDEANMDRLAAALRELGARIRTGDPDGVAFPINTGFLVSQPHMLNLTTDAGDLDLTITPSGFPDGYATLIDDAVELDLGGGTQVMVASLADVITSKEAAGRDKDHRALPYLRALQEEIASSG
ncbi:nucleotidyl transferase AbiEii/AbiGii toxin family protein [Euzebya tangerina]|uniref:nucleotidyl transferase AbiEii/AbiGii toxin family protein n=1 Tax=Euzebya tangerina TaxID=591198 RepID=UPI000E312935|nr:nucleotidyl transferase AbiEii/AbiGii toxin family protein [Euzebya tangerina]